MTAQISNDILIDARIRRIIEITITINDIVTALPFQVEIYEKRKNSTLHYIHIFPADHFNSYWATISNEEKSTRKHIFYSLTEEERKSILEMIRSSIKISKKDFELTFSKK